MVKPVSLSVHRNTRDQRRRHRLSKLLVSDAKAIGSGKAVDGYAIVAWMKGGKWSVCWESGSVGPNGLADFVGGAIRRKQAVLDSCDEIYGPPDDAA